MVRVYDLDICSIANFSSNLACAVTRVRVVRELRLQPSISLILGVNYYTLDWCIFYHDSVTNGESVTRQLIDDPFFYYDCIAEELNKIVILSNL